VTDLGALVALLGAAVGDPDFFALGIADGFIGAATVIETVRAVLPIVRVTKYVPGVTKFKVGIVTVPSLVVLVLIREIESPEGNLMLAFTAVPLATEGIVMPRVFPTARVMVCLFFATLNVLLAAVFEFSTLKNGLLLDV
jgi:hypothetical protein